jgi:segregation and condensation protein B
MSLKSKIEAVIYAAEEPVTLTQLAALFAAEALDWRSAQEAAAAIETTPAVDQAQSAIAEGLEYLDLRTEEGTLIEGDATDAPVEAVAALLPENAFEAKSQDEETHAETPEDIEAEAKREARQRDREVKAVLRQLIEEIMATCASDERGVEIREIAGGYRMATKPECHDAVRMFVKSLKPALKLSLPALETLAVIAYKQPVTAPEVNEIRGVDSSGVFGSLMARKLITTAGRKQVIGRPILYKTTKEFLLRFGLKDVSELPSMDEFEKMAAIELEEPDQAEGPESETDKSYEAGAVGGGPELDEDAPEEPEIGETNQEEAKSVESQGSASSDFVEDAGTVVGENESNVVAEPAE